MKVSPSKVEKRHSVEYKLCLTGHLWWAPHNRRTFLPQKLVKQLFSDTNITSRDKGLTQAQYCETHESTSHLVSQIHSKM